MLPFGFKQGASGCQLVTDAVIFFMWTQHHWVVNYLDDIIGVPQASDTTEAFLMLHSLLDSLGLPINFKKVKGPASEITSLGINISTHTGLLSIPQEKTSKIRKLIQIWSYKTTPTHLNSITLILLYIHCCISQLVCSPIEF